MPGSNFTFLIRYGALPLYSGYTSISPSSKALRTTCVAPVPHFSFTLMPFASSASLTIGHNREASVSILEPMVMPASAGAGAATAAAQHRAMVINASIGLALLTILAISVSGKMRHLHAALVMLQLKTCFHAQANSAWLRQEQGIARLDGDHIAGHVIDLGAIRQVGAKQAELIGARLVGQGSVDHIRRWDLFVTALRFGKVGVGIATVGEAGRDTDLILAIHGNAVAEGGVGGKTRRIRRAAAGRYVLRGDAGDHSFPGVSIVIRSAQAKRGVAAQLEGRFHFQALAADLARVQGVVISARQLVKHLHIAPVDAVDADIERHAAVQQGVFRAELIVPQAVRCKRGRCMDAAEVEWHGLVIAAVAETLAGAGIHHMVGIDPVSGGKAWIRALRSGAAGAGFRDTHRRRRGTDKVTEQTRKTQVKILGAA